MHHADGPMRFDAPKGTDAYYEPNSFGGPVQDPRLLPSRRSTFRARNAAAQLQPSGRQRRLHSTGQSLPPADDNGAAAQRLFNNVAAAMAGVPENIIRRQLLHFQKAEDPR